MTPRVGPEQAAPDPADFCNVFIDESSHNNHDYFVLGGVVVELNDTTKLDQILTQARQPELPFGEAKWVKVSRAKLPAYKRLVDALFDNLDLVHCHTLVVDTRRQNHAVWNEGSREIGFNKEVYQLAMKFARLYSDKLFHVYPDHRETNQTPEDLRLILNRGRQKNGDGRDWPFRRCHFRKSKGCLPLQLVDIVIGGLAFCLNGHGNAQNASPAKCELAQYLLERAGVEDVYRDTAVAAPFTIWHRRLR